MIAEINKLPCYIAIAIANKWATAILSWSFTTNSFSRVWLPYYLPFCKITVKFYRLLAVITIFQLIDLIVVGVILWVNVYNVIWSNQQMFSVVVNYSWHMDRIIYLFKTTLDSGAFCAKNTWFMYLMIIISILLNHANG